jgi:hypothetical protein
VAQTARLGRCRRARDFRCRPGRKDATVLGDPDQPHTYIDIPDIGEGLAVLGEHRMRRLLSQTRLDQSRRAAAIAGAMNALSERRK